MKYLLLFVLLFLLSPGVYGQEEQKDYKTLSKFFLEIIHKFNTDTANKVSHVFSVKIRLNTQHKVDTVIFSKNTPPEIKDKLAQLKTLLINWNKLLPLKKGVKATIIIPIGELKATPAGIIHLSTLKGHTADMFAYEDGSELFNNTLISGIYFMNGFFIRKFIDYPPQY